MLYPSHWGSFEYDIENPNSQPYDIVFRSLEDFERAVEGTGARIVPWLQDFSLGVEYGPAEVKAQIDATADAGIDEFLLWDPAVTYTGRALTRDARLPTTGTAAVAGGSDDLVELEAQGTGNAPVDSGLVPNELGVVPVLMHHQILPDGGGDYDLTPEEFRDELERLYREHYRPITAADLVAGTIDVPKGTTPVVLTFDDSTANQAALLDDGTIDPNTAVGIMLAFAEEHPGFEPVATFYLNRDPFAAEEKTGDLLRWLVAKGFELGNHTKDHLLLSDLSRQEVQQQIVLEQRIIHESVPDYDVTTMALTFGIPPEPPRLAWKGAWDGEPYQFAGVMLVGAGPAPSPYSREFKANAIPRIRTFPTPDLENGSADWLNRLAQNPELRYVSDGDPGQITYPEARAGELADGLESRANGY
jgi:peptidoglycan/xylan/chitin deacetylase (PgdA/CDA1 family)